MVARARFFRPALRAGARALLLVRRDLTAQALEYAAAGTSASATFTAAATATALASALAAPAAATGAAGAAVGYAEGLAAAGAGGRPRGLAGRGVASLDVEDDRLGAAVEELCGGRARMAFRDYHAVLAAEDATAALRRRGGLRAQAGDALDEEVPAQRTVPMPDGKVLDYDRAAAEAAAVPDNAARAVSSSSPSSSGSSSSALPPVIGSLRIEGTAAARLVAFAERHCGVLGTIPDRDGVGVRGSYV